MTVKTIYMLNWHTRSHLKKVSRVVRHTELSAYVQPYRKHQYRKHSQDLIKRFIEKGYNESTVRRQVERTEHLDRSLLLKHPKPKRQDTIPFSLT